MKLNKYIIFILCTFSILKGMLFIDENNPPVKVTNESRRFIEITFTSDLQKPGKVYTIHPKLETKGRWYASGIWDMTTDFKELGFSPEIDKFYVIIKAFKPIRKRVDSAEKLLQKGNLISDVVYQVNIKPVKPRANVYEFDINYNKITGFSFKGTVTIIKKLGKRLRTTFLNLEINKLGPIAKVIPKKK